MASFNSILCSKTLLSDQARWEVLGAGLPHMCLGAGQIWASRQPEALWPLCEVRRPVSPTVLGLSSQGRTTACLRTETLGPTAPGEGRGFGTRVGTWLSVWMAPIGRADLLKVAMSWHPALARAPRMKLCQVPVRPSLRGFVIRVVMVGAGGTVQTCGD